MKELKDWSKPEVEKLDVVLTEDQPPYPPGQDSSFSNPGQGGGNPWGGGDPPGQQ